jgi:hypothetical protein
VMSYTMYMPFSRWLELSPRSLHLEGLTASCAKAHSSPKRGSRAYRDRNITQVDSRKNLSYYTYFNNTGRLFNFGSRREAVFRDSPANISHIL